MGDQRTVGKGLPGEPLDQSGSRVSLPLPVDLLTEPLAQWLELAPGQRPGQPAQVGLRLGEQLGRVQVPQGIGGKIADQPGAPVDVLEHAAGIVGRIDLEAPAVLLVPGPRQLDDRQIALQQGLLQLEPDEDVQVVGRLVGLHPDQRRPHVVDRRIEVVQPDVGQRLGKTALGLGEEVLPEGPAPSDHVLPQPGLRLVDAQ